MEGLAMEQASRTRTIVRLEEEPVESLVACLAQVICRVLATSPLKRALTQAEFGTIRAAAREAVWETLESVEESAGGGRIATFTPVGGVENDWTAGIAWRVAAALAPGIDDPAVFEYLAEELPAEAAEQIGLADAGACEGSMARCHCMAVGSLPRSCE